MYCPYHFESGLAQLPLLINAANKCHNSEHQLNKANKCHNSNKQLYNVGIVQQVMTGAQ